MTKTETKSTVLVKHHLKQRKRAPPPFEILTAPSNFGV